MRKLPDIYFTPQYGRLYEEHERGTLEVFTYENGSGKINCQFMKRALTGFKGFEEYCDLITPYGYGGPVILQCPDDEKEKLVEGFKKAFAEYCKENKIVSYFIRFHPLFRNAADFNMAFDEVILNRRTIAVDLTKDVFCDEFSQSVRRNYRKAERENVIVKYDPDLNTIDTFKKLYCEAMNRKGASEYYYFSDHYFNDIKMHLCGHAEIVNAVQHGNIVATLLLFKYGEFVHAHLCATTPEGYATNANEYILADSMLKTSEQGYKWYHMGGGITNSPDDSVLRFKCKFTKSDPFDFYIGKSIYIEDVYYELCRIAEQKNDSQLDEGFFPRYRA